MFSKKIYLMTLAALLTGCSYDSQGEQRFLNNAHNVAENFFNIGQNSEDAQTAHRAAERIYNARPLEKDTTPQADSSSSKPSAQSTDNE